MIVVYQDSIVSFEIVPLLLAPLNAPFNLCYAILFVELRIISLRKPSRCRYIRLEIPLTLAFAFCPEGLANDKCMDNQLWPIKATNYTSNIRFSVIRMPQLTTGEPHGISFKLIETGKLQLSTKSTTPTFPHASLIDLTSMIPLRSSVNTYRE